MTSLYVWLKFTHLVGLALFLFGHGISGGTSYALRARPSLDVSRAMLMLSVWSYRITYPGLLLLVASGVWMGFLGRLWGRGWLWTAIAILVVLFVVMGALSASFHRSRDAVNNDAELSASLAKTHPDAIALVGTIGLVAIMFLMVLKPF